MFHYTFIHKADFTIQNFYIDTIFFTISKIVHKTQKWTINIVFLDDDSIKNLNKTYREKNTSTDVLSFHYFDTFEHLSKDEIAWEIILSQTKIISQWREYELWTEKEFYKLLIHSILHILWYDHEEENEYQVMQKLEDQIWKEVFEK
jgi:probable rRNA maturation factor